jgi:recombination protein RecR
VSRDQVSDPIGEMVQLLGRLPGIGERTATRLANYLLGAPAEYVQALGKAIAEIQHHTGRCSICGTYTSGSLCSICGDPVRDSSLLCVVARPADLAAVERTGFRGRYYVLHGLISPLEGMGPEKILLAPLIELIERQSVTEVILATPLSVEGEATALYLAEELKSRAVRCTRIASGVPHGGELEYTDQITLSRALQGRREL